MLFVNNGCLICGEIAVPQASNERRNATYFTISFS